MRFHDFTKRKPLGEKEMSAEDHSLTGGYRIVHDSYFTVTFLTQNEALRTLAEKSDLVSGFFNRMMFSMGKQRADRLLTNVISPDPNPPYKAKYERMWKDCTAKERVIPFSDDALELGDTHPLRERLKVIEKISPMYARWQMMMLRTAFLLAVNENATEIDVKHVNAASEVVHGYLIPCASSMVESGKTPEKSEKAELGEAIVGWIGEHFDKKKTWPEIRQIKATRFWNGAEPETRNRVMQLLQQSQDLVSVMLLDGPWGNGGRSVAVLPDGDFSVYYDANNKKYKSNDFYDGRSQR